MNYNIYIRSFLYFVCLLGLFSCKNVSEIKFHKSKWAEKEDMEFLYRDRMLKDLTTNFKLVGLKNNEIVELLGKPNYSDNTSCGYEVIVDYGWDIDPIYTKDLCFEFNDDNMVISFKITEWKK